MQVIYSTCGAELILKHDSGFYPSHAFVRVCVCVCGHVYVVYEDTNLYNDMGMT